MISAFLKRLLFARQFFMINGKIEVLGVRQGMIPSNLLFKLQQTNQKEVYTVVKKLMYDNITYLGKKLGASQEGIIKNVEDIYETMGLGQLQIIDLDKAKKRAIVRVHNSPIAEAFLKENKKSKEVVCTLISGTLAGMFSFLFDGQINVEEKICVAQEKDFCEFIVQS